MLLLRSPASWSVVDNLPSHWSSYFICGIDSFKQCSVFSSDSSIASWRFFLAWMIRIDIDIDNNKNITDILSLFKTINILSLSSIFISCVNDRLAAKKYLKY